MRPVFYFIAGIRHNTKIPVLCTGSNRIMLNMHT